MFLTRASSIRSKSPLRGKRRSNRSRSGSGGGGNGGLLGLGGGLRVADLDGVSMLSNSPSMINPSEKETNLSRSSTSSSLHSLPSEERDQFCDLRTRAAKRKPRLSKIRDKDNFLSIDNDILSRHRKLKQGTKSSKKKIRIPPPLLFTDHNTNIEEDVAESDSSDGIILPAITVPRNFNTNMEQTAEPNSMVKICIDSPSEEELSFRKGANVTNNQFDSTVV